MGNHVYKSVVITGRRRADRGRGELAIAKASEPIRNLRWFEITETRDTSRTRRFRTGR
jgi:flavin-binding protein dodecin